MLQEKHAVKASVENPAAPASASKKEQSTAHPGTASIQNYVMVAMESLAQSLKGLEEVILQVQTRVCFDTIKEEKISDVTLLSGKRKLETIFRVPLLCSFGRRIFRKPE